MKIKNPLARVPVKLKKKKKSFLFSLALRCIGGLPISTRNKSSGRRAGGCGHGGLNAGALDESGLGDGNRAGALGKVNFFFFEDNVRRVNLDQRFPTFLRLHQ